MWKLKYLNSQILNWLIILLYDDGNISLDLDNKYDKQIQFVHDDQSETKILTNEKIGEMQQKYYLCSTNIN